MSENWRDAGLDLDLSRLWYLGERNSVADYLRDRGWEVTARPRPEVFAGYGVDFPAGDAGASLRNSLCVTATKG